MTWPSSPPASTISWPPFRSFFGIFGRSSPTNRTALLASAAVILFSWGSLPGVEAQDAAPPPPPVRAKAWVLVDAVTGAVLEARNARIPLPPASLSKLITALVAVRALDDDAGVPVTARAAAMPARKLNMEAGEEWPLRDVLHSMLMSSANDAAAAVAESVAGSLEAFAPVLQASAGHLGLEDSPILRDPSGFDDAASVEGGNLVSARDLAIVARAAMAEPVLAAVVGLREYAFTGPDGVPHRLINHNRLLRLYPGAVGLKTGYTRKAGNTLAAAARRDGRTLIVVLLGVEDMYGAAASMMDRGFATPAGAAGRPADRLPAIRRLPTSFPLIDAAGAGLALGTDTAAGGDSRAGSPALRLAATASLGLAGSGCFLRVRVLRAQAGRRRTRRRHPARPPNSGVHGVPIRYPMYSRSVRPPA